jgi:hypothetical protein
MDRVDRRRRRVGHPGEFDHRSGQHLELKRPAGLDVLRYAGGLLRLDREQHDVEGAPAP